MIKIFYVLVNVNQNTLNGILVYLLFVIMSHSWLLFKSVSICSKPWEGRLLSTSLKSSLTVRLRVW